MKEIDFCQTPSIRDLISTRESIPPETLVSELAQRFYDEPELDALPIVKDGYPCGLATRRKILTTLAIRFGFALYGRKPIGVIADMNPMLAHCNDGLNEILGKAMARDFNDIYDEILVVDDDGCYVGSLSVKRLVVEQGEHLAQSIAQRELAIAKAVEIEKMNEVKSNFMAHVTHELRSPVSAIAGFAELIQLRYDKQNLKDFPKYLRLLSTNAQNLRSLVNNILDLSKIEAGRMELHNERFFLCDLLREVLETCRMLAGDKPITFEVGCPDGKILVETDRIKIRQILLNLASNAVKYSDRGIIEISASLSDQLCLSVKDTGIGIRKEHLSRLFQSFEQLEDAKSRRQEGTGLGLAITQQLVHFLGGRISVDSTFGIGSWFDVTLPCTIVQKIREAS